MTKDYEHARGEMSSKAIRVAAQIGNERAIQHFLGWIDALTIAVFDLQGGATPGSICLRVDNTNPDPEYPRAA